MFIETICFGFEMARKLPILFKIVFFLTLHGEVAGQSFGLERCEYEENGQTIFSACVGEPFMSLLPGKSNYNISVTPADATCGMNGPEQFCLKYSVSIYPEMKHRTVYYICSKY